MGESPRALDGVRPRDDELFWRVAGRIPVAFAIVSAEGRFIYTFPVGAGVLGYNWDLVGRGIDDIAHPDDVPLLRRELANALARPGEDLMIEVRVRRVDGGWRRLEVRFTNLLDDPGVVGIVVAGHDVTERHEADQALPRSEARFRALVERSADGVVLFDRDGRLLATPHFKEILGYQRDQQVGKQVAAFADPRDRAAFEKCLEETVTAPGRSVPFLIRALPRAGGELWVEGALTNLLDDPNVGAIVCNYRDVTEQKHAEEERLQLQSALEGVAAEWTSTFDAVDMAVIVLDPQRRVTRLNRRACVLADRTYGEAVGRTLSELGPDEPWATAAGLLPPAGAEPEGGWTRLATVTARGRTSEVSTHPLTLRDLSQPRTLVLIRDVTYVVRLARFTADLGRAGVTLGPSAHEALQSYAWPGNIREMRNVLERAVLLGEGAILDRQDLRFQSAVAPAGDEPDGTLEEAERRHVERTLRKEDGNVERAARRLGISRSALYQRIKKMGLSLPRA